MTVPPALLLGGGSIAVPIARSLARSGVCVHALGTADDPVRHSRYCAAYIDLGGGEGVQDRWLNWLGDGPSRGAVLLPCNDDALELVARHRSSLVELGYRPIDANDEIVLAMLDKSATYALARRVGLPVPATALVGERVDLVPAAAEIGFPLALKPRHAHRFAHHFGLGCKVLLVNDQRELAERAAEMRSLGLEMLLTEVIPGADDTYHSYYTYIDAKGKPLVQLTKHKLRQFPVHFGLATYHVIDRDEETMGLGRRFFAEIGLRGTGCVEFKRDARDGRLKLIECNPRFTTGNELVRQAGIDLALLAYNRAVGRPDPPAATYRTGVRMWHPVEDTRAFLAYRRLGELTVARWARSLLHRQHFPLFSFRDPKPSLMSNAGLPRSAFVRVPRVLRDAGKALAAGRQERG